MVERGGATRGLEVASMAVLVRWFGLLVVGRGEDNFGFVGVVAGFGFVVVRTGLRLWVDRGCGLEVDDDERCVVFTLAWPVVGGGVGFLLVAGTWHLQPRQSRP